MLVRSIPWATAIGFAGASALWLLSGSVEAPLRVPGTDVIGLTLPGPAEVDLTGELQRFEVDQPREQFIGGWPGFRGPHRDAIARDIGPLSRSAPQSLWTINLGAGYAGAAVWNGRVYVLDYDEQLKRDVLRCISLENGQEIWRRGYGIEIGRNHGMSRTVPAVTDQYVVALGPKCHVTCVDAITGEFIWGIDLVREMGSIVPPWYAGQCPLIDGDRVILAPGGPDKLMVAVELATGKIIWTAPNPHGWQMTHSSIVPMEFNGRRMYLYCGSGGVAGVSSEDGTILWQTDQWRVSMANVPSPVVVGDGRILLTGGYGAGAMMIQLREEAGKMEPVILWRTRPTVLGAEQHTPILYQGHIYAIIPGGELACVDLDGQQVWKSGPRNRFGLGPFMIADGMIIVLADSGRLTFAEATPRGYLPITSAQLIEDAHEAWGPLALANGRLIARDMHRMVCLEIGKEPQ